jgi:hypothetical protein
MQIKDIFEKIQLMNSFPKVRISLSGGEDGKDLYRYFTKPHSKYKVIQNKKWGVALVKLPENFEDYLNGSLKQLLRRKRKRAMTKGYSFACFSPLDLLDEMMIIHQSVDQRQGEPIHPDYLSIEKVKGYFNEVPTVYGVFDDQNTLQAYTHAPMYGEMFMFNRLLGHAEHLNNGIMYLLMSEVIRLMIEQRNLNGEPSWAMYDTFLGASEGLRYFKERIGFEPYNVEWIWGE